MLFWRKASSGRIVLVFLFLTALVGACSSSPQIAKPTPTPPAVSTVTAVNGGGTAQVAYTCLPPSRTTTTICTSSLAGSGLRQFTQLPAGACCPRWSPNGRRIAFVVGDLARNLDDIWVMNADGSDAVNLTHDPQQVNQAPSWSPDGKQIVFMANVGNTSKLFLMNANGTGKRLLPLTAQMEGDFPAWSPNGQEIAFVSRISATLSAIEMIHLNGSGSVTRIIEDPGYFSSLVWSPDGQRLLYSYGAYQPGGVVSNIEAYAMNADGSHQIQLTNDPSGYYGSVPSSWSPDGTQILVWRAHDFGPPSHAFVGATWIMNANDLALHQLSLPGQPQDGAIWQP